VIDVEKKLKFKHRKESTTKNYRPRSRTANEDVK
jgi:hypothetical protein